MSIQSRTRIPVLKGPSDYFDWSVKVKAILMARSRLVWRRVTNEAVAPALGTEAYDAWEAAGDQAFELVLQGLEGEALTLVSTCDTAADAWQVLKARYGRAEMSELLAITRELESTKQGSLSTNSFINLVINNKNRLANYGRNTDPYKVCSILIEGLDNKFTHWKSMLYNTLNTASTAAEAEVATIIANANATINNDAPNVAGVEAAIGYCSSNSTTASHARCSSISSH